MQKIQKSEKENLLTIKKKVIVKFDSIKIGNSQENLSVTIPMDTVPTTETENTINPTTLGFGN